MLVLSPVLERGNFEERLTAAAGKTREQIELLVAGWKPKPLVETRIFEVKVDHRQARLDELVQARAAETSAEGKREEERREERVELPRAPRPRPLDPQHYKLQLCIDVETYEDSRWLQNHMRHSIPDGDAAKVISKAIKALRKEVEKRRYGKTGKPKKQASAQLAMPTGEATPMDQTTPTNTARAESNPDARSPGRATRREVSERDGCQCTYVSPDGRRCDGAAWLEFDHIIPFAEGGPTLPDNLRTSCKAHHRARNRHPPRGGSRESAIEDNTDA